MIRDLSPETARTVENAGEAAEFLKKLAHPSRLMIAALRASGFITGRKESKHMFYRLEDGRVSEFISMMHAMFCAAPAKGSKP
jgi:hypothetical protein